MPSFSQSSKDKLSTCHQDLQTLMNEVIRWYDCTIVCGYRGKEDQDAAYASGHSQVQWPNGKHNKLPSDAVDAVTFEVNNVDWSEAQSIYFAGFVMGIAVRLFDEGKITHRIRCGVDFNKNNDVDDDGFFDPGHFEIIKIYT